MIGNFIFFPLAEQYTLSNEWKTLVIIFNILHVKLQKHSIFEELMQCNFDHYEASDTMPIVIKIYDYC